MEKVFVVTYEGYDSKFNDHVSYIIGTYRTMESAAKVIDEARDRHHKDDADKIVYEEWMRNKSYKVRYLHDLADIDNYDECCDCEQDYYLINEEELAD